ncbi:MAG: ATP-binding protein [Luteolibacter sp.]
MGLIGNSGAGKSCALSCVIQRLRKPFLWWSGTEARDAAIDAATADNKSREGHRQAWEHAMRVPLLALDDISQGKMTEAWSSKLFDLLETRLSNGLPTLWTSQISMSNFRSQIAHQNGGDVAQAEAISRRLNQHSHVIKA